MKLKWMEKGILLTLLHDALEKGEESPVFKGRYWGSNIEYVKELVEKIEKEKV